MLVGAEREHDERDLESLQEDPLEGDREGVAVEARLAAPPAARAASVSSLKVSSSSCLAFRPAERRIALRSHCRPKISSRPPTTTLSTSIGSAVSAGPSARHDRGERERRGAGAAHRRGPAARGADREHDRQRLDRLDGAGEEDRDGESDLRAAHARDAVCSRVIALLPCVGSDDGVFSERLPAVE